MKLAREIVSIYHSEAAAAQAEEAFVRVFQQGNIPERCPNTVCSPVRPCWSVLVAAGLVASKSDGRRMIEQNGVRLDGQELDNPSQPFPHPGVLQVGKRRYLRIL